MSAREAILSAIRAARVPAVAPPARMSASVASNDLITPFLEMLRQVGGDGAEQSASKSVEQLVTSWFPGSRTGVVTIRAHFGVAENAAVYVDAAALSARAAIVRAEHLIVLLSKNAIVATMHEAVQRMPRHSTCGWFLSGPSKTADIEQSLVIGAQGARTLRVILIA